MNITHDLIAAVTGPGWKFGLSRILINDQDEGVVFIAGSKVPHAYFTVDEVKASRGNGTSEEGQISWRRRGSSCQYKLAKCKVATTTLEEWWVDSLSDYVEPPADPEPEAEAQVEEEPEPEPEVEAEPVPTGSAAKVMSWVGDDPQRAQSALEVEQAGQQRIGLTADLEKVLAAEELL